MSNRLRWRLLLLVFCAAMQLAGIAGRSLTVLDETRVMGIAREMALEGELVVPRLNGIPYLEYPPLGYLPWVALFRLGLVHSDLVALLPSALASLLTVLATFCIGRRLGGEPAGLAAALALQCTFGFLAVSHRALVDPQLAMWITISLAGFAAAMDSPRGRGLGLFYLALAGGFLTKGLLGIGLPVAVAACYLLVARRLREIPRLAFHPGVGMLLLPIGLWQLGVWAEGGSALALEVWWQSIRRFVSASADHASPLHFYLDRLAYLLAPGVVLLQWLLRDACASKPRRAVQGRRNLDRLPGVWVAVILGVLSLASAKRNLYLGPLYPGFALMLGCWWSRARLQRPRARWARALASAVPRRASGWVALAVCYVGVYLGYALAFEYPRTAAYSPAALFADAERQRDATGAHVVLIRPRESIQGAAVYCLGETVPMARNEDWFEMSAKPGTKYLAIGHADDVDPLLALLGRRRSAILATHDIAGEPYRIASVGPLGRARDR